MPKAYKLLNFSKEKLNNSETSIPEIGKAEILRISSELDEILLESEKPNSYEDSEESLKSMELGKSIARNLMSKLILKISKMNKSDEILAQTKVCEDLLKSLCLAVLEVISGSKDQIKYIESFDQIASANGF